MALGYQLAELLKEGFLKEYLEVNNGEQQGEVVLRDPPHEVPVHAELNTILGGFSGGGSMAAKCKRYARAVMTLEAHTRPRSLFHQGRPGGHSPS